MTRAEHPVSIIIPTRNRRVSLERSLHALSRQSHPTGSIEVVVVADGCTDGTAQLANSPWPIDVRVIEQPPGGAGAARNRGAAAASHDLLVFLDDDIEAWPGLVSAHVRAHAEDDRSVVVGYLPPQLQGRQDLFAIMLRAWWEAMFERMAGPGHRFNYTDLLSGNFSLQRPLFNAVGGFDPGLQCHEDYELGVRLIAAGAELRFAPEAAGWHHEYTGLERALARKRDEGRADVTLARRHPALTPSLPLSGRHEHCTWRDRTMRRLAVAVPGAGDLLAACYGPVLALLERCRLRTRWRRLLDELLSYWYWRGVGEALGSQSPASLRQSASAAPAVPCDLDLRVGLEDAMRRIDAMRPDSLRLRWADQMVGQVAPQAGAEPLAGRHLPDLLRGPFAQSFAAALERANALDIHVQTGVKADRDAC